MILTMKRKSQIDGYRTRADDAAHKEQTNNKHNKDNNNNNDNDNNANTMQLC